MHPASAPLPVLVAGAICHTRIHVGARGRPPSAIGLLCLVMSGLLWGTGRLTGSLLSRVAGLTGSLLSRVVGLPAMSVAAYRLTAGGALIVASPMAPPSRR